MLNRSRCILCTRYIRFMAEVDGDAQIGTVDSHIGDEAITPLGHRLDETRTACMIVERGAHFRDRKVQSAIELDEGLIAPKVLPQLLARNEFAASTDEEEQRLARLCGEVHTPALPSKFAGVLVQLEHAESCDRHQGTSYRSG